MINDLLNTNSFLKTLFHSIPCGVLIVDGSRRVQAVNDIIDRTFGVDPETVVNQLGGEALGCIHANDSPQGCGHSDYCTGCEIRKAAEDALGGNRVLRHRAQVELHRGNAPGERTLLVSAAPLEHAGEHLAVILLEDITELTVLRRRLKSEHSFQGIIGRNPRMVELFESIRELADIDVPVLIQGETGTGKELVASAIHNEGPRKDNLFVPVNCAALPEGLLESELFGHVKGAFTGAVRDKKGRFELADNGTIFLDEIGDISQAMQVKILRVLEEGTFERVGSEETKKVDIRVLSATNKNLMREIAKGNFRKDLYYRLAVVPVDLPPLRERRGDIPLLCENAIEKADRGSFTLSPEALDLLMAYSWPGNIRELQNWIQYAMLQAREGIIRPEHLPREHLQIKTPGRRSRKRKLSQAAVDKALAETNGNKVKAAALLNVARATLYRFLDDSPEA